MNANTAALPASSATPSAEANGAADVRFASQDCTPLAGRWFEAAGRPWAAEQRHDLYRSALFPVISLYMADDEMLAEDGARLMFEAHGNGRHFEVLHASDGQRIGHLGIFKTRHQNTHWPRLLHHLQTFSTP
jgi:hypothetical protein